MAPGVGIRLKARVPRQLFVKYRKTPSTALWRESQRGLSKETGFGLPLRLFNRKASERPQVPDGVRIYAVGDVHGRADLLAKTFANIDADLRKHPVGRAIQVMIGDYIDRGPASRGTIDMLIERGHHHEMVFLKGNHETFVPGFIRNPGMLQAWREVGGLQTLVSYGLRPSLNAGPAEQADLARAFHAALPTSHMEFLSHLKSNFIFGDYYFVHAGVRPGVDLEHQREEDLLWIRDDFLLSEDDFGKFIVHGHTPVREPDIRPNRINIDTGAYATGNLTCVVFEKDTCVVL